MVASIRERQFLSGGGGRCSQEAGDDSNDRRRGGLKMVILGLLKNLILDKLSSAEAADLHDSLVTYGFSCRSGALARQVFQQPHSKPFDFAPFGSEPQGRRQDRLREESLLAASSSVLCAKDPSSASRRTQDDTAGRFFNSPAGADYEGQKKSEISQEWVLTRASP